MLCQYSAHLTKQAIRLPETGICKRAFDSVRCCYFTSAYSDLLVNVDYQPHLNFNS